MDGIPERRDMQRLQIPLESILDHSKLPWKDPQIPKYKTGTFGKWTLNENPIPICRGYFRGLQEMNGMNYVLEKDKTVWMSLTHMETESQGHHIQSANGRVVVVGAGMGFYLFNVLRKTKVKRVLLIEKDASIMNMLWHQGFYDWRGYKKLSIWIGNVFELPKYFHNRNYDYLFVDIWKNLGAYEALEQTQKIQDMIKAKKVGFWGQELDFISYCHTKGYSPPPTKKQYSEFIESTGIPLDPFRKYDYPSLCIKAAENSLQY